MPTLDYLIHKLMSRFVLHQHVGGEGSTIPAWTILYNPTDVTSTYTIREVDMMISCNGSFTLTLPAVSDGKAYIIKNIGIGIVTLKTDGAETIDGELSLQLSLQYDYVSIVGSDEWLIVGGGNVKLEDTLNKLLTEQNNLLKKILIEEKKSSLHLAEGSGAKIDDNDAEKA